MKAITRLRALQIFTAALDHEGEARPHFVESSCVGDQELRAEVERLLAADREPASFLERGAGIPLSHLAHPALLEAGARIGKYELEDVIASGGMGTVYAAWQESPHRKVAIKTLRGGFASAAARKRFRFEAEVLGSLRHPAIAQIHEFGTDVHDGRELPFLAMEFVAGARDVLTYVRAQGLERRERIGLFLAFADAVHHGHQRGVIHRDLKPSNLLVDENGAPKVIDFGLARAVDAGCSDLSATETRSGGFAGTLQYMSPEQLAGDVDLDVRCDVYALGLVLFQLLTDAFPYELEGKNLIQIAATITNEEPIGLHALDPSLPMDLHWIIGRALAKERERRYFSVAELAQDIRRHLRHEAVSAGPNSGLYLARKFVRRHRALLASVAAVIIALTVGLVRAQVALAQAERDAEKAWAISGFFERMLAPVSPLEDGQEVRVASLLQVASRTIDREFTGRPEAEALVRSTIGRAYTDLRIFDEAQTVLAPAVAWVRANKESDDPLTIKILESQLRFLFLTNRLTAAKDLARELEPIASRRLGDEHELTLQIRGNLAEILLWLGELDEAETRYDVHLAAVRNKYGERHTETIGVRGGRALVWLLQDRLEDAHAELERVLALCEAEFPPEHWRVWNAKLNLANAYRGLERFEDARELLRSIHDHCIVRYGPEHSFTSTVATNLGGTLGALGRYDEALAVLRQTAKTLVSSLGEESPDVATCRLMIAETLLRAGRHGEAAEVCRNALVPLPGDHPSMGALRTTLEEALAFRGTAGTASDPP